MTVAFDAWPPEGGAALEVTVCERTWKAVAYRRPGDDVLFLRFAPVYVLAASLQDAVSSCASIGVPPEAVVSLGRQTIPGAMIPLRQLLVTRSFLDLDDAVELLDGALARADRGMRSRASVLLDRLRYLHSALWPVNIQEVYGSEA